MLEVMNLSTLSISFILGALIGTQQTLKTLIYGLSNREDLLVSLRGSIIVTITIWLIGFLICGVLKSLIKILSDKNKKISELNKDRRFNDLVMAGVFLSIGMFLFAAERVPLFATPYPLLAYSGLVMIVVLISTVMGLMVYASLDYYKKWINKINWNIWINALGGVVLVFWIGVTTPLLIKRLGLRIRRTDKTNVVLITSDTLRGDRFTAEYMPETYEWFSKGTIFERAYSTSPWTVPSFASMMTGKYSGELSADNFQWWIDDNFLLLPKEETLAEKFQDRGYSTTAVLTNGYLVEDRGFDQGFDVYENVEFTKSYHWRPAMKETGLYITLEQLGLENQMRKVYEYFVGMTEESDELIADAEMVSSEAIRQIQGLKEPFFVWIHYYDAHGIYNPPEGYGPDISNLSDDLKKAVMSGDIDKDNLELREVVIGLYDGEVRYHDKEIARVLRFLDRRGLSKRTAVVFTADHGEQFWEGGQYGHGFSLRNEEIRVPLAVSSIFDFDNQIAENNEVSLYLLGDWLLDMAEGDPDHWLEEELSRSVFAEGLRSGVEKKGIVNEEWKLVWEIENNNTSLKNAFNDESYRGYMYPSISGTLESELRSWNENNEEAGGNYRKALERVDVNLPEVSGY